MSEGKRIEAEYMGEEQEKAKKAAEARQKAKEKAEREKHRKRISGKKPAENRLTGHAAGNSGDMMSEGKRIEAERQAEEEEKAAKAAWKKAKAERRPEDKADDVGKKPAKNRPTGHAAGNSGDMMSEGKRIEAERQAEEEE